MIKCLLLVNKALALAVAVIAPVHRWEPKSPLSGYSSLFRLIVNGIIGIYIWENAKNVLIPRLPCSLGKGAISGNKNGIKHRHSIYSSDTWKPLGLKQVQSYFFSPCNADLSRAQKVTRKATVH